MVVALSQPTTAGTPNSREIMAAWQVRPPLLVTIAEAIFIIGSQSGVVISAINTSPALNSPNCSALRITRAVPTAILLPTECPVTKALAPCFSVYCSNTIPLNCETTVSGLACTMYNTPSKPSFAHSISIGLACPAFLL